MMQRFDRGGRPYVEYLERTWTTVRRDSERTSVNERADITARIILVRNEKRYLHVHIGR